MNVVFVDVCTVMLHVSAYLLSLLFFFNETPTTEIYTLSLHDALPIYPRDGQLDLAQDLAVGRTEGGGGFHRLDRHPADRSEEHTSELQSRENLVCRLLLEKKKQTHEHSYDQPTMTCNKDLINLLHLHL